jgi:long-chain fatty acid transport protein
MGWSVHDELVPDLEEEVHPLLRGSAGPIPRDYNDTMDYAVGLRYRVNEALSLTGGYIFDESPVPEETADPVLADTDMHALTAGFQYRKGSCDIAFGYYIGLPNSRSVRRNVDGFNGRYKFSFHLLALKVNYIF